MRAKGGFTLVELIIIVVILGVLAAIIVPQFSRASAEAKESSLRTYLQVVRSRIELYKIQHSDALPGTASVGFVLAMTGRTDSNGNAGADYGPYLQKIPVNSFNSLNTVRQDGTAAGANTAGWRFDTVSGVFQADDSDTHATF